MAINTLRDLLEHEIRDLHDAQNHLRNVRPGLVERVTDDPLREALEKHVEETGAQVERLGRCAEILDIDPGGVKCHGMDGLLREAREMEEEATTEEARDAAILLAVQKIEHYEIASYGGAATWSEMLGLDEVASLLKECIAEAKGADERLKEIAKDHVDWQAASVPAAD